MRRTYKNGAVIPYSWSQFVQKFICWAWEVCLCRYQEAVWGYVFELELVLASKGVEAKWVKHT